MSEEKLTVAELMARAAKEGHSTDAPRRRRRRSIEDGGISVAELTGSIPAVKEKPVESKHSAVKIDDPAEPEQKPEQKAEPKPEPKAEPKSEQPAKTPATPAAKPAAKPAVDKKPGQKASTSTPAPKAAELATEKVVDKPAPKAEPKLSVVKDSATDTAEKDAPARPAPSTDETIVLSIVDEKDPIRLTTGAFPVVPPSAVKPAPATPAAGATGEEAADAEFAAAGASPADTTQMDAITGDFDQIDATDRDEDHEDADEEPGKISVFSVLLMAIVGVVLGAAVFLAFEMLWERLSNWLVAILAVAVTLGMVGLVHALRTSRDRFSMVLAGIVGLVMTFGPLLVVF
ncbi:hypothetical protein [Corynebacterium gallinarum]|uniref:hypothetical protein n=1 Tax=Corynebacterium gallinarum TaxID=2762214 RepID=UPI001CD8EFF9|nr:hypothetical protein [Corynebacterium gallinarum]